MRRAYAALPGVPDEMVAPDGRIRPLWRELHEAFAAARPEEIEARRARAEQYLRDSGVFYRQYGSAGSDERPWPLSPVPVLIAEDEWQGLMDGLIQRATLLERVMADLYGPGRLVAEGHLPPELVAGNPEWLRPMVGVKPSSGHYLHFLAFEIGRGPDGKWWVLADRAQAPSGAGYALENRVATSRAMAELHASTNVHRLAGFFRDFRRGLADLAGRPDPRIVILTPGPMNETYYEQAWIARYLGVTLVQGEDLTVTDGHLHLRTVGGATPVDVLWRRLDSSYADPVELDPASRLGTPGMVSALRAGGLHMVNSLGSGLLETRALMAFLPRLSEALTGRPLTIPNIATWWLGDAVARANLLTNPENRVLMPALSTGLPFGGEEARPLASDLGTERLAQVLGGDPGGLVAQELVRLSTTPALVDGRLEPRPVVLRVFLARVDGAWQPMMGGFARIGAERDPEAIAMQRGGSSADVWIIGEGPVDRSSLVSSEIGARPRSEPFSLPARTADNLFWLGRHIERSEAAVRLLRACHVRLAESARAARPLIEATEPLLELHGMDLRKGVPPALVHGLEAAMETAGRVRDRFSPDAWSALADLTRTAGRMTLKVTPGDDAARALSALLRKLAGITGLVHENMYRSNGWRFLSLGRMQERAMAMTAALAVLADAEMPDGALDMAIELGDSVLTHRRRFTLGTSRASVIDLLLLDADNPRSLRHQIDGILHSLAELPHAEVEGRPSALLRAAMRLQVDLATAAPEDLDTEALWEIRGRIADLSDLLTEACFR